jgi:hypothetical protein
MPDFILSKDLYAQANAAGVTLSQYLEQVAPAPDGSKLTAFENQLKEQNIIAKSVPAKGFSASKVEAFYQTEESKTLFPEYIGTQLREGLVAASILPFLTTNVTMIDSNSFRAPYLDFDETNKKASKKRRVTEGADLPIAKIRLREKAVNIFKYGLAIQASKEAIRRMKIDALARHIRFISMQMGLDEADAVLDVLLSGDGNANTAAAQLALTSMDSGATKLTRAAWIKFLLQFYPYGCDTVVGGENALVQVLDVLTPSNREKVEQSLSDNGSVTLNVNFPQGIFKPVTFLYYPDTPKISTKDTLFGLARDYAVEKVMEIGSDINDADRFIMNQTEVLTISENSGFASMYPQAAKILTL